MPDLSPQDLDLVTRTLLSEGGNEGASGMAAIANVIRNRANSGSFGESPADIVLAPNQFSAWSLPQSDPNSPLRWSPQSPTYQRASQIAANVWSGANQDPTNGSTYYYNPSLVTKPPAFTKTNQPLAKIGNHTFYGSAQNVTSAADIAQTVQALGLSPGSIGSPVNHAPADLQSSADALGISTTPKAVQPITGTVPVSGSNSSLGAQVLEGMPIVGPLMDKAIAATGAAIQPMMGVGALGTSTFGERYTKNLADIAGGNASYAAANPGTSTAANVVGAGMLTAPLAASSVLGRLFGTVGTTLGARLYGGMAGGAAINAADAALRDQDVKTGALVGAAGGGVGVLGGEAIGKGIQAARTAMSNPGGPLADVNTIGRGWLAGAMANETPASLTAAANKVGPAGFVADLNPALTNLATGVATLGEAPASTAITEAYRTRAAGQAGRIDAALTQAMGPSVNVVDTLDAMTQQRKAVADPLYEQWRSMPVPQTPGLSALEPRLDAAGAFDQAEKLSAIQGNPLDREAMTPQSWDYVKRGLDSKIDTAYGAGDKTTAAALVGLKNELIGQIQQTPAGQVWQQARNAFAEKSGLMDQLVAGRDTFIGGRSGLTADELANELQGLSQPELQARIMGMRSAAADAMADSVNGDTTLRNKLLSQTNQKKMKLMIGDNAGQQLVDTLQQEKTLADTTQYVLPTRGSPTAGRTAAVNALQPAPLGQYNPDLTKPLSFIPPSWIDAIRPSTVLQGGRGANYAAARQQIANVLLTRQPGFADLLASLGRESANRGAAAATARQASNALAAGAAGAANIYRNRALPNSSPLIAGAQ